MIYHSELGEGQTPEPCSLTFLKPPLWHYYVSRAAFPQTLSHPWHLLDSSGCRDVKYLLLVDHFMHSLSMNIGYSVTLKLTKQNVLRRKVNVLESHFPRHKFLVNSE